MIIQFYNRELDSSHNIIVFNITYFVEGSTEYTTCAGLLTASSSQWPQSALFQIAASGVPLNKLVIGKPGTSGDASNGFMSTSLLASCVSQAKAQGWNAGVMVWEVSTMKEFKLKSLISQLLSTLMRPLLGLPPYAPKHSLFKKNNHAKFIYYFFLVFIGVSQLVCSYEYMLYLCINLWIT